CASLRFAGGALGTLLCSTTSTSRWSAHLEVVGTAGYFGVSIGYPTRLLALDIPGDPDAVRRLWGLAGAPPAPPPGQHYYGASHDHQIRNFLAAVLGRERLRVGLDEGLQTLRGVNLIYRAARGE